MLRTQLLQVVDLERQPCCIAFSPNQREIFIVGTYMFKSDESEERTGNLIVYRLRHGVVQQLQTISFPFAILDLRFSPIRPENFAFATSIGTVGNGTLASATLQSADVQSPQSLLTISDMDMVATGQDVLVTSLAYTPFGWETSAIAVTMSDGSVAILNPGDPIKVDRKTDVHSIAQKPTEAWVVAWVPKRERLNADKTLYTGGDDAALCRHPVVEPQAGPKVFGVADALTRFDRDRHAHISGVVAIVPLWLFDKNEILLTGSYDEYIRVLSINPRIPKANVKAEKKLDGGVWQLKLLERPSKPHDPAGISFPVLASCMHAGCKIVEVRRHARSEWSIEILASFIDPDHDCPLYYASDFQVASNDLRIQDMTFVSTTFYDKKLFVWIVEKERAEEKDNVEDNEVQSEKEKGPEAE